MCNPTDLESKQTFIWHQISAQWWNTVWIKEEQWFYKFTPNFTHANRGIWTVMQCLYLFFSQHLTFILTFLNHHIQSCQYFEFYCLVSRGFVYMLSNVWERQRSAVLFTQHCISFWLYIEHWLLELLKSACLTSEKIGSGCNTIPVEFRWEMKAWICSLELVCMLRPEVGIYSSSLWSVLLWSFGFSSV